MLTAALHGAEEDKDITYSSDCESACEVLEVDRHHLDEIFDEEVRVFDMTSLNTLVLLNNAERAVNDAESHRLSLAYERLSKIPAVILNELAPYVSILDISHNKFSNLDFLIEFKQLTSLICDHNDITSSTEIPYMPNLELLWMNHCKITELYPWARKLRQSCPNLRYLLLMGNVAAPSYLNGGNFYEYVQYRLFMISQFPNLVHLDDRLVTNDQRMEAERLYKRPFLERIVSKTPSTPPNYLRTVGEKVSGLFANPPNFVTPPVRTQRNLIV